MNFIKAIQHATIGYGIRRKEWHERNILSLDEGIILSLDEGMVNPGLVWVDGAHFSNADHVGLRCKIGGEFEFDLNAADLMATDWEVV